MKDVLAMVILPKIVYRKAYYKAVYSANASLLLVDQMIELVTISGHLPWNPGYAPVGYTNRGNLNSNM